MTNRIKELYHLFLTYGVVTTDSRNIIPGSIFFALRGDRFDGNRYAISALDAGAAIAVVDNPSVIPVFGEAGSTEEPEALFLAESDIPDKKAGDKYKGRFFLVDDTLTTLQKLASHHRRELGLTILAITGSNGKTTTKELVASVLASKYWVEYTRGNLNNHIGVPLTLLSISPETEIGIVEMGANHPGEIELLCRLATPDYGLVTNVGRAHLEGFGSFEGVVQTKSELYRFLEARGGTVFINGANQWLMSSAGPRLRKVLYNANTPLKGGNGEERSVKTAKAGRELPQISGKATGNTPFLEVEINSGEAGWKLSTNLIGEYNLENVLAAVTIGQYFGVDTDLIKAAIGDYEPSNNRSQLIKTGCYNVIMDAYNANPSSMLAAIRNFAGLEYPLKMVILGDMLELGNTSGEEHQMIIDELSVHFSEGVFLAGPQFGATRRPSGFLSFATVNELSQWLKDHPLPECWLLVKGSRGMELEKVLTTCM